MADSGVNPTAAALLGLLHEGPMTGGQLMAAAERRLAPYWSMTRSQVYRELPVLAERGFVRLGKPGPRMSQPYAITASREADILPLAGGEPGAGHHPQPDRAADRVRQPALGQPAARACTPRPTNTTPRPSPRSGSRSRTPKGRRRVRRQRAGVRRRLPQGRPVLAQERARVRRADRPPSWVSRRSAGTVRGCATAARAVRLSVVTAADYAEQLKELDAHPAQHRGRPRPRPPARGQGRAGGGRRPRPICGTTRPRPSR